MSAPSIPNLLSMRGGGSGGRGGRGRRQDRASSAKASHDTTIQGTDTDAAVSRLSAVDAGYLQDPYARYFVSSADGPPPRRFPIINRGTYTRITALDVLIESFLTVDKTPEPRWRQIVSLGAGTDTRPFRLFSRPHGSRIIYHELDFAVTCARKRRVVEGAPSLAGILTAVDTLPDGTSWSSRPASGGEYYCHGIDLRDLVGAQDPAQAIPGLRTDVPTLLISECCLCYLAPSESSSIIEHFTSQIPNLGLVIYEPIRPDDAFGRVMVSNLAARNVHMPTLESYPNNEAQVSRLRQAGFESARCKTIKDIWSTWIMPREKERVDALEGLDEVEEWELLASHYAIVWGFRGSGLGLLDEVDMPS
ncbi:hypothetical protein S7711_08226 [Stachybotrys chartarum IBT 7711]|uniref:Leucine carboxyl methyltransferase 1 n=1 Tax=Stachybotrys chartarum (strain CBS 109288 / IBT 7711) TaxID=1280523 RepID=A0A084AJR6_STACB|nr:hypothetical protein S7711_08226 [Stachybotrys chartarum IBT 7711]KFA72737.1 hypothetical protein S40288_06112 [Stachybotrys chartarum IBT 40288]